MAETCKRGDGDALAATGYHVNLAIMRPPHALDLCRAADRMEHWDAVPPVLLHLRGAPAAIYSIAAARVLHTIAGIVYQVIIAYVLRL